jgi:hypothetical protein
MKKAAIKPRAHFKSHFSLIGLSLGIEMRTKTGSNLQPAIFKTPPKGVLNIASNSITKIYYQNPLLMERNLGCLVFLLQS